MQLSLALLSPTFRFFFGGPDSSSDISVVVASAEELVPHPTPLKHTEPELISDTTLLSSPEVEQIPVYIYAHTHAHAYKHTHTHYSHEPAPPTHGSYTYARR